MKRIEQMIQHIRLTTDNTQKNTMTDDVLVQFMNDAVNRAQSLIFQKNPECRAFDVVGYKTLVNGTADYALDMMEDENSIVSPSLIYTTGSISLVERCDSNISTSKQKGFTDANVNTTTGAITMAGSAVASSFTDGAVNLVNGNITVAAHNFTAADNVKLSNVGGALPTGFVSGINYWVIYVDGNTIRLASSLSNAIAGVQVIPTAAGGGGTHTCYKQIPGHNFTNIEKVRLSNVGGALPVGFYPNIDYWVIYVDESTIKLANSSSNALSGIAVIPSSSAGGGTHTCYSLAVSGNAAFYRVKLIGPGERLVGMGYTILRNNLQIMPAPQSGKLRITYTKKLTPVDIRRGKVTTVNSGVSLVVSGVPTKTDFANVDYICVVDKDGNIIRPNIAITGFTSGTGTIATTDALTGVTSSHYVCYGKYATTSPIGNGDPMLDDTLERYLNEYVIMRVFMMDSSKDISAQSTLVKAIEDEIMNLYADNNGDAQNIPILTTDYLTL